MLAFLYRFRGVITAFLGALLLFLPPVFEVFNSSFFIAAFLLAFAFFLRVWARMHIGEHTRGKELACPEVASAGPYKYIKHPLYISNFMAGAAFALFHAGFSAESLCFCAVYCIFLAILAANESAYLKKQPAPQASGVLRCGAKQAIAGDISTWFWQIAMLILIFLRKSLDKADFFCYIIVPNF